MTRLVIIGCGGFGREVHDIVDALIGAGEPLELLGFVDDAPRPEWRELVEARGSRVLGPLSWFEDADRDIQYVIGIGSPGICARMDAHLTGLGFTAAVLVHPAATTGWDVRLEPGAIVCAGAHLSTHIRVGRHAHIDRACVVGHDAVIEDYAIAYPSAAIAGATTIGRRSLLGTMSAVIQGLEIGEGATIGAGAVVTRDVPAGTTAVGVPARWRPAQPADQQPRNG